MVRSTRLACTLNEHHGRRSERADGGERKEGCVGGNGAGSRCYHGCFRCCIMGEEQGPRRLNRWLSAVRSLAPSRQVQWKGKRYEWQTTDSDREPGMKLGFLYVENGRFRPGDEGRGRLGVCSNGDPRTSSNLLVFGRWGERIKKRSHRRAKKTGARLASGPGLVFRNEIES